MDARKINCITVSGVFATGALVFTNVFTTWLKSTTIQEQTREALSFLPDLASLLDSVNLMSDEAAASMANAPNSLAHVFSSATEFEGARYALILCLLGTALTAAYKTNKINQMQNKRIDALEKQVGQLLSLNRSNQDTVVEIKDEDMLGNEEEIPLITMSNRPK